MDNPIQEIIQGSVGGLIAGIMGYMADAVAGAIFESFTIFNPLIPLLGFIYALVTFVSGLKEAYVTGFFFSIGIVAAGFLMTDIGTVISGLISIGGLVFSIIKS